MSEFSTKSTRRSIRARDSTHCYGATRVAGCNAGTRRLAHAPRGDPGYDAAVRRAGRLVSGGGVLVTVLVTSAGACQQDRDGPLPTPDEIGAAPFPDGAVVGGLDAVYATLVDTVRLREDGRPFERQCYSLLRLREDGVAETSQACTTTGDITESAAADATWEQPYFVGDYAVADGMVWTRMVDWDFIVEELELVENTTPYCVDGLYGRTFTGDVAVTARLVVGDPPPDAPPCD
jgi:hypothetical protein